MSKYRNTIRSGVLIREKRGLILFWRWYFNRSEEDEITKLKNRQVNAERELRNVQRAIPRHETQLSNAKKVLSDMGGTSPIWREGWAPRRNPSKAILPGDKPKKSPDTTKKDSKPLFETHLVNGRK